MKEVNVLVTGAAGQIGYALLTRLASGETFGSDVKVNLNLVEVPQVVSRLEGSRMELEDCGFNTLGTVKNFSDNNINSTPLKFNSSSTKGTVLRFFIPF